jgi:hypothetical protein
MPNSLNLLGFRWVVNAANRGLPKNPVKLQNPADPAGLAKLLKPAAEVLCLVASAADQENQENRANKFAN